MKKAKQILAIALCLLMLNSNEVLTTVLATVSGNDAVVETSAQIKAVEVCGECGSSGAHTEICSLNMSNTYANEEESITLDFLPTGLIAESESMTDTTAVITANPVKLYKSLDNGAEGIEVTVESGTVIDLITKYTFTLSDTETLVFYRYDYYGTNEALNNAAFSEYSGHVFVYAGDITLQGSDDTIVETEKTDSATGVAISADLPEDVTLTVTPMTADSSGLDTTTYPINGASLFYDVTLLQNDAEYQPENGITITFPESAITDSGLAAGDYYKVYHIHDEVTDVTGPFQYTGGAIEATFDILSTVGIAESGSGIKLTDVYGEFVSEESYSGYAVINTDTIRVYGAADTGTTDYYELTGVSGIAIELITPKAKYEKGVLYHFYYSGDDETMRQVNYYFIPEEFITLTCCADCTGVARCNCGCENCTCEEESDATVTITSCSTTVNGVSITVEGNMLSGSTLSASAYTVTDPGVFGLADTSNIKAAYDIKLLDADSNAIQPDGSVFVTMDASAMGLSSGDVVELIHQHGSTVETSKHVVINGKLIFPVSGFSVFIVNSTTDTTGTEITGNSENNPYVMTVGETKIFFDSYGGGVSPYTAVTNTTAQQMYNNRNSTTYYYLDNNGTYHEVEITRTRSGVGSGGNSYTYTISYADGSLTIEDKVPGNLQLSNTYYYQATGSTSYRGEWQVTDESMAITYEITSVNYQNNQHMAPYIEVTAKDVGLVKLTYKYVSGGSIHEETLYISVVAPTNELYVDDQVAESGCLVPVGLENVEGVTYTWTRSDGQVIRSEALNTDGTVNVSLDRGGLTEGRDPITYTVTATLTDGTTMTASYEVLYSNEILNTSFETPALGKQEGVGGNQYVYNGYPGLYWKTTAPGSSTSQLTQDIEMIQEGTWADTYFGVQDAADGSQYVELNAEAFGALYQDILTTPGATLSWAFSHNGRTTSGSNNTMYVVVAATKNAASIIDEEDIDALLEEIPNGANVPSSGEGYKLTYNGATYYIWKHVADNAPSTWEKISGSYSVPEGQYLTRLFFASETNVDLDNKTLGNLIDAVSAGETMSYKIEYYVGGSLVSANTQTGNATVYTTVALQHLQSYIDNGYVLTAAKLTLVTGNVDYPGNIANGLYITSYGDSGDEDHAIILKVYLAKRAVTITKNIVIDGWANMTDEEKTALIGNGLTAKFALTSNSKTYTAELTIIAVSSTGELTVMGEFVDSNGDAPVNGIYTVTETSAPTINGYSCSTAFDTTTITISDTNPTGAIVCTNTYEQSAGTLVIEKTVTLAYENDTLPNDTFTFTVSGDTLVDGIYNVTVDGVSNTVQASNGKFTVSLSGFKAGQKKTITISGIPAGEYTVTESSDEDYSTTAPNGSITVAAGGTGTASFTNVYKRHLVDLKIEKTGWNTTDEKQSFIFDVTGPSDFKITVTINGNGEVTIKDLPIGEYTVTERTNWSWRYNVASVTATTDESSEIVESGIKFDLTAAGETVEFENNRSLIYWLSGDSYNENQFTVKSKDEKN